MSRQPQILRNSCTAYQKAIFFAFLLLPISHTPLRFIFRFCICC